MKIYIAKTDPIAIATIDSHDNEVVIRDFDKLAVSIDNKLIDITWDAAERILEMRHGQTVLSATAIIND